MAYIERRDAGRWRVRYRDPAGRERSKSFRRRVDAEAFLTSTQADLQAGDWVDPRRGRMPFGEYAADWLARKREQVKASTAQDYDSLLRTCILPTFDQVPLAGVDEDAVADWLAGLARRGLGASRVRKAHRVLHMILAAAVKSRRVKRNTAAGADLPRLPQQAHRYLSHGQVQALADAAGGYRVLVLTLAYTGLRFGEAAGLRGGAVDLMRRRLRVSAAVSEVNGALVWDTPKSHAVRSVPVPRFLADMLAEHLAGEPGDALVFPSPEGEPLRNQNFRRRVWDAAVTAAGVGPLTPHDLRHTAASLAVASGADVKAVQRMLGHKSAAMTLDVYADLFDDSLDTVADRLDAAFSDARAASVRPGPVADVVDIRAAGS